MDASLINVMKDTSGYDRTFNRYRVNFPVCLEMAEEEGAVSENRLTGLVYNLSLSGVGFVCSKLWELDDMVRIEITLAERSFSLLTVVRWCQLVERPGKPVYRYGAQFVRTEESLKFIPLAAKYLRERTGAASSRI